MSATPTPTPTADPYAPSSVLTAALLTAKQLKGSKASDSGTEGPSDRNFAGYSTGFSFVKGDAGCKQLLGSHPVRVATGSWVSLDASDLSISQMVESFGSEADAITVMDQNMAQVKGCKQATVSYKGKQYRATHTLLVAVNVEGQTVGVVHQLTVRLAPNANLAIVMNERRHGGEIMFLNAIPSSLKGITQMDALMPVAAKKFIATLDAYRSKHPRPLGA